MAYLDLSQYDTPFDASCFKAAGVDGVILGVFHPGGKEKMAEAAGQLITAGVPIIGFYGLPYFGSLFGEQRDISWAIENALRFGVSRVWIDCEIDAAPFGFTDDVGATPARRVKVIRELVAKIRAAGLEPGIYSAPWWWKPETGNSTEFADLPLWFANYPDNGRAMDTLPEPFGGWTKPAVHQYTSTLYVCGRDRDANYVFEETNDMTPEQTIEHNAMVAIFGGRAKLVEAQTKGMDYLLGYAIEQADQNALEKLVAAMKEERGVTRAQIEAAVDAFKAALG